MRERQGDKGGPRYKLSGLGTRPYFVTSGSSQCKSWLMIECMVSVIPTPNTHTPELQQVLHVGHPGRGGGNTKQRAASLAITAYTLYLGGLQRFELLVVVQSLMDALPRWS